MHYFRNILSFCIGTIVGLSMDCVYQTIETSMVYCRILDPRLYFHFDPMLAPNRKSMTMLNCRTNKNGHVGDLKKE